MAGQLEIANVALSRLGADHITSLEDGTTEQKLVVNLWDTSRRACLRDHPWNFAITDVELSQISGYTPFEYQYAYQLPADNLRVIQVFNNPVYKIQGSRLLTNQPVVKLKYVQDVTDSTLWDAAFTDLMAQRLAVDMGYALTKSQATADSMYAIYGQKLKIARHIDSTEDTLDALGGNESDFTAARY